MKKFLVAVIIILLAVFVIIPKWREKEAEKAVNKTEIATQTTQNSEENTASSKEEVTTSGSDKKNDSEETKATKAEENNQSETNPAEQTENTESQKVTVEQPEAVLIENEYGMKQRTPQIYSSVYDVMSGDVLKLNKPGKFTVLLFGEVVAVYVTSDATSYSEYQTVTITEVKETAEPYYTFAYECALGSKKMFRIVMADETEYFFSVQKT